MGNAKAWAPICLGFGSSRANDQLFQAVFSNRCVRAVQLMLQINGRSFCCTCEGESRNTAQVATWLVAGQSTLAFIGAGSAGHCVARNWGILNGVFHSQNIASPSGFAA